MKRIFAISIHESFREYINIVLHYQVQPIPNFVNPSKLYEPEVLDRNNVFIIDVHSGEPLNDCNLLNEIKKNYKIANSEFKAKFIFLTWFPPAYLKYYHENGIKKNYYLSNLHSDHIRIYQLPLLDSDIDKMNEFIKS